MDTLRSRFPDVDSGVLERFLNSADGKEGKGGAIEAVEKHIAWKKSLPPLDEMYDKSWVELEKKKLYERGRDKAGHTILWWQTSNNDPKVRNLETMAMAGIFWILTVEKKLDEAKARGEDAEVSIVWIERTTSLTFPLCAT